MQAIAWIAAVVAVCVSEAAAGDATRPNDLAGKVVDQQGQPVTGANVFIYTAKPRASAGILCPGCYPDCAKETTTNAEGKFLIRALDPSLLFRVLVVAEGFRPSFAADVDPQAEPATVRLQPVPKGLDPRNVLRGRVVDREGTPIVGATVDPFGIKTATRHWYGRMPGVDPLAVTNDDGRFMIFSKEPDVSLHLEVSARRHATRIFDLLPTGEKAHELVLGDGVVVTGTLVRDGEPVAGVTAALCQCDRSSGQFVGEYQIDTDEHGRFEFSNVIPNNDVYLYTKMKDAARVGFLPVKCVALGRHGSRVEVGPLRLDPAHRLAGRVVLVDGKPIPEGTQLLVGREYVWDTARVVLAPDGRFALPGVPTEPLEIITRIPGYRMAGHRMPFQQTRSSTVAVYVDRDRTDLEIFLEPEPKLAKP
ncbi:MAG TPA: carboxypeptidase-like regulatory domain-containing protein [Thermoguttaceae bacterium]|nr:carboxypeptidase-like regulatory domain-containing protein [Thermoguttaceae bacterium]